MSKPLRLLLAAVAILAVGVVAAVYFLRGDSAPAYRAPQTAADVTKAGDDLNAYFAKKYGIKQFVSKPFSDLKPGEASWFDISQVFYTEEYVFEEGKPFVSHRWDIVGKARPEGSYLMLTFEPTNPDDYSDDDAVTSVVLKTPCSGRDKFSPTDLAATTHKWIGHRIEFDGTEQPACLVPAVAGTTSGAA